MEKNYQNVSYLNYEAYLELIKRIAAVHEYYHMEALDMSVSAIRNYVEEVDNGEQAIAMAYFKLEGELYRETVSRYDAKRRIAHEAAISSCSMLNRLAKFYSLPNIFTGDTEDRLQVADFCLDVVVTVFKNRKMN